VCDLGEMAGGHLGAARVVDAVDSTAGLSVIRSPGSLERWMDWRPARALNGSRSRPVPWFRAATTPIAAERNTRPARAGSVDAGLWIVHRAFAQAGNDAPMTLSDDEQHSSDPNPPCGLPIRSCAAAIGRPTTSSNSPLAAGFGLMALSGRGPRSVMHHLVVSAVFG